MTILTFIKNLVIKVISSGKRTPDKSKLDKLDSLLEQALIEIEKLNKLDSRLTSLVTCILSRYETILTDVRNCLDELRLKKSRRHLNSKND